MPVGLRENNQRRRYKIPFRSFVSGRKKYGSIALYETFVDPKGKERGNRSGFVVRNGPQERNSSLFVSVRFSGKAERERAMESCIAE